MRFTLKLFKLVQSNIDQGSEYNMKWLILGGGGIGSALAQAGVERGNDVQVLSRRTVLDQPPLLTTADWLDIQNAIAQLPELPDVFVSTVGMLSTPEQGPEKRLAELNPDHLWHSVAANTLAPMAALQALQQRMTRQSPLRALVLTAKVGSISDNKLGGWYSYRASKAITHMLLKTTAIEWQRQHPQACLGAYHPGTTDTALSQPFQSRVPAEQLKTPAAAAACLSAVIERLTPELSGRFWHWDGSELPW
jgi:NAD(P)-dependent dehydrogenase (short-subunit alcohol dehydrogenase family)